MKRITALLSLVVLFYSCSKVNVFEKNVPIPDHTWSNSFKPEISFDIGDTSGLYNIYVVLRHSNAYKYKNIWLNIGIQPPGGNLRKEKFDLPLATDEKGWLGKGMDDIFEHRILLYSQYPLKKGTYRFQLENIMREDPLDDVMNVGIRIEKVL